MKVTCALSLKAAAGSILPVMASPDSLHATRALKVSTCLLNEVTLWTRPLYGISQHSWSRRWCGGNRRRCLPEGERGATTKATLTMVAKAASVLLILYQRGSQPFPA